MQQYQQDFIDFIISTGSLKFGKFTLKSGRVSPYFFNTGVFNTGEHLIKLGEFYAQAIVANQLNFDILFGPAYKGIPLVSSTAIALKHKFNKNVKYSFNRKETKNYGEGGNIVGSEIKNKILIIDDVITAGTAINEVITIIDNYDAQISGVIVALDRQEKGNNKYSAITDIETKLNIKVHHIINLDNIINYLKHINNKKLVNSIEDYQQQYGF